MTKKLQDSVQTMRGAKSSTVVRGRKCGQPRASSVPGHLLARACARKTCL